MMVVPLLGFDRKLSSKDGFRMPVEVDESKIKASYKDGILEVHMPRKSDGKGTIKYIDIS